MNKHANLRKYQEKLLSLYREAEKELSDYELGALWDTEIPTPAVASLYTHDADTPEYRRFKQFDLGRVSPPEDKDADE